MTKRHIKHLIISVVLISASILTLALITIPSFAYQPPSGNAGAGNGPVGGGGNCKQGTVGFRICAQTLGATWRFYAIDPENPIKTGLINPIEEGVNLINGLNLESLHTTFDYYDPSADIYMVHTEGKFAGGPVEKCKNTGGFYLLGLELGYEAADGNLHRTGIQFGIRSNNTLTNLGGATPLVLPPNTPDLGPGYGEPRDFETTKKDFDLAVANGVVPSGVTWNNVGYFCSDPGWDDDPCDPTQEDCGDDDPCDPENEDCGGGDDDPCDPNKEICDGSGEAEFTSTTTVHVDATEDIHESYYDAGSGTWKNTKNDPSGPDNLSNWKPLEATSPVDGNAMIKFSTDQYETVVKFWHNLTYDGYISTSSESSADNQDASWTSDCTLPEGTIGACLPNKSTGTWTGKGKGGGISDKLNETSVTVQLNPGQTKTVCQRIDYSPKYVDYYEKTYSCGEDGNDACKYDPSKYGVEKTGGSGSSYACAQITRPAEPDGDGPFSTATANGTIMFAGETASIGWDAFATSYPTRRLSAWQAIVYRVAPQKQYDDVNLIGTAHVYNRFRGTGACDYYKNLYAGGTCKVIGGRQGTLNYGARQAMHLDYADGGQEESIVVPNNVGAKYCNSFAYKYEFWYAYVFSDKEYNTEPEDDMDDNEDDEDEDDDDWDGNPWDDGSDNPLEPGDWHKIPGRDYWNVYDSACRTIAKKPTTAVWNSSLLTNGGIKTSKAYRYDSSDLMGKTTGNIRSNRTLYTSWVEHLAVVNGLVSTTGSAGFTSGSTSAIGSTRDNSRICAAELTRTNSPLTIANTECGSITNPSSTTLGNSGIFNNSTYRIRLRTYLENHADQSLSASDTIKVKVGDNERLYYTLNNIDTSNMSGTTIVKVPGDLRITKNIILNNENTYSSIYDLPQTVLFVDGNVEISSDVTEIDAWIVANGTVNSCYEFVSGVTASDANNNYMSDTCTKQLIFNAPVMADDLKLYRSFGSDIITTDRVGTFNYLGSIGSSNAEKYNAAEVFNLRADVYLWAYAQAGRYDSSYTESYSRELAPRY